MKHKSFALDTKEKSRVHFVLENKTAASFLSLVWS